MRWASFFWKKNAGECFFARNYPMSGWHAGVVPSRSYGGAQLFLSGKAVLRHPGNCGRGGIRAFLTLALCAFLVGCAGQTPLPAAPSMPSVPLVSDVQHCLSRAECSTKLSRTLLFVFDYAAAGAPLVQREGPLLFTPVDAPMSDWPPLTIRLAEAEQSAFAFNAQCRATACRLTVEQLLQIYHSYLADQPCAFSVAVCSLE